jgi:hypothetical protein
LDALATRKDNLEGKPSSYDTNYDTRPTSSGMEADASYRKEWSGREDLNLRPPGPEQREVNSKLLVWNRLSNRYPRKLHPCTQAVLRGQQETLDA